MSTRRNFLKTSLVGASAMALGPRAVMAKAGSGKPPMRFIFMHRGNGLFPRVCAPPTLSKADMDIEKKKGPLNIDLDKHELPQWMSPLSKHKQNLTILQGLSGKMCTVGHHSWCSSLGVFKANERLSSIKWATVDFELAKLFPSPMEHIELACFPTGGGNARGALDGVAKGFSARGPQQPNHAFGSPKGALKELFKSVSTDKNDQVQYELDRKVLEFVSKNHASLAKNLGGIEKAKIQNYGEAVEAIRRRDQKVDAMAEQIRKHVPKLDEKYLADNMSTLDRQSGHTEVLLSALISGLTNVVAFTVDELGHPYTGLPGIENEKVNMHDVGHNKTIGGLAPEKIRELARTHHMKLMGSIVERLKAVPEAGGTMFDNTMVFYFPDGGETHHSHGWEFPFVVMSGKNCKLDIARRYIRLPNYGQKGHSTLGNWYTTLLNAYGNSIDHFGAIDTGLEKFKINQKGPIESLMA